MLKQRIITALWLAPLALAGCFLLDGGLFALFVALVVGLAGWEWARLSGVESFADQAGYGAATALCCGLLWFVPVFNGVVLALSALWWMLAFILLMAYPAGSNLFNCRYVRLALGFVLLLPAWLGLVLLKQWAHGNALILLLLLLVWGADIGAYFSGKRFGRNKLAPEVSPGKTREGVFGGMVVGLVLVLLAALLYDWSVRQLLVAMVGSLLVIMASVVGDLTESLFKRRAGVKDSSNLLPGHGGVLDRIDSLTAAVPVFTLLLWLHGWGSL